MYNRKYSVAMRIVALFVCIVLMLPMQSKAATAETVQPRASLYLTSYNAYVYPAANGKIQAWFTVTGCGRQDSIGALHITIYESADNTNWTLRKIYRHTDYPHLLSYNDNYHSGYVEYQGTPGRYYKAYVCIWGGSDGDGDTRYFYTSAKKAVLNPS